jgi:hypothetical protein
MCFQEIRNGSRRIYGMQSECAWKTYGVIGWWVLISEALSIELKQGLQAIQPTEKSFRPSHRASVHGSILHDASYFGLIELKGAQLALCRALEMCCNPVGAGPTSKRCVVF